MKITNASSLTDSELVTEVARLAGGEREATVALIVHLAEFEGRRLFEAAGFSSTFRYCMEVLRLSEDATFNRIEAARIASRYPAPERYVIRFTASAETHEKLRLAQDLLGHAVPSGELAEVFDRALTLLVEDLQRKKFAATRRPRASRGQSEDSRNIPAEVRRAVAIRDGSRCAFVASSGRRCGERRFLEFHHVLPYGARGKPTVENIQLRCRAHNRYEAELFYGPGRRYGGGDVVSEPVAVYGCVTGTQPVPERVTWRGPSARSRSAAVAILCL